MKIYVVHGTCGDYSDRSEWVICAYESEHLAKAHVEAAGTFTRAHSNTPDSEDDTEENRPTNPWDPIGYYDSWSTPTYWYDNTELKQVH